VDGYPSPCGCALLAPTPCVSTPCASVTAYNVEVHLDDGIVCGINHGGGRHVVGVGQLLRRRRLRFRQVNVHAQAGRVVGVGTHALEPSRGEGQRGGGRPG